MTGITPDVRAFFASYRAAFERLDADAVADHFAFPTLITGEAEEIVPLLITSSQEWTAQLNQLFNGYQILGVSSAKILEMSVTELSPHLYQAGVHWALHGGGGDPIYDFLASYTLAEIRGHLRITAISHNEGPKLRTSLARLRSGSPRMESAS